MLLKSMNKEALKIKINDLADKSMLIVDDDNPLRDRLSRAMEKKGFKVFQASSVKQGINLAQNSPPAFAVIDLRLDDGSGLDIVKEIRKFCDYWVVEIKKMCNFVFIYDH